MEKKKKQTEWERAINLMTEDELQFIIQHQVGYYPGFLEMVRGKRWDDDPYSVSENEAMMDAVLHILEEMGCQCEIDEDDEIFFCCLIFFYNFFQLSVTGTIVVDLGNQFLPFRAC